MKIYENGVLRDATQEEQEQFAANEPQPVTTLEDRIAELEQELAAAKLVLGVE